MIIIHGMNKNYIPRWAAEELRRALVATPVLVLTGIRQVGKSTLLRNEDPFKDWTYYDLDDPDTRLMAESDPYALFHSPNVVIDEVQKFPELLNLTKVLVDQGQVEHVVLSGSANLLLMKSVSESLAGRASFVPLMPMPLREALGLPPDPVLALLTGHGDLTTLELSRPRPSPRFLLWRGMLPPVLPWEEDPDPVRRWMKGYLMSYLERDLRALSAVTSLTDFQRVMARLALSTGSILNETEIARDTGVKQPTVHRWLSLLETSGIVFRVPGFYSSRVKRLIKREKVYFTDPGIAAALMGFTDPEAIQDQDLGPLLETYVGMALNVYGQLLTPPAQLYHWRTGDGQEVDFVWVWGQHLCPVEVKAKKTIRYRDFNRILKLMDADPRADQGLIVYLGEEPRRFGPRLLAIPWHWL